MIYLLIIYIIFLVVYLIFSVAAIYHLFRFGYVGDLTKPVIAVYSIASAVIIFLSLIFVVASWPTDAGIL